MLASTCLAVVGATVLSASAAAAPPDDTDPAGSPVLDEHGDESLGSRSVVSAAAAEDRYIVQVEDEAVVPDLVDELEDGGAAVADVLNGAFDGVVATLDPNEVDELRGRAGVVRVERDHPIKLHGVQSGAPWNLDRIDQRSRSLNGRYTYALTGSGVSAYVVDSGIRRTHTDFGSRVAAGAYWDFGDGTGTNDCNGHGTHVAGTLGGARWGVAKSATIVPVKVFSCSGSTSDSIVIAGINWIISNHAAGTPAVANMSLGGPPSSALDSAVNMMIADRITVIVSAGNDAQPTCNYSPARVAAAITVAASMVGDLAAPFSNAGPCNDLFAPGVSIRSASHLSNTGNVVFQGTSMAAPHVAGAAAQYLQITRTASPAQVWTAISNLSTKGAMADECCGEPDKLLYVMAQTVPSAARSLVATSRDRAVALSWVSPTMSGGQAITDYVIQRSTNGGTSWTTLIDGVSTARTFTNTGLTNGTRYTYRVAAKSSVGTGAWSNLAAAVPAAVVPSVPRSVAASAANTSVLLTWASPATNGGATITDYVIRRSSDGGLTWVVVNDGVSALGRSTMSNLSNGTRYLFRIAAKNSAGIGPFSAAVAATPQALPGAPTGLVATPADGQVQLDWTAPANNGGAPITDYVIRMADGVTTWSIADGVSAAPNAVISGLTNGVPYQFEVAAVNAAGTGGYTPHVIATASAEG